MKVYIISIGVGSTFQHMKKYRVACNLCEEPKLNIYPHHTALRILFGDGNSDIGDSVILLFTCLFAPVK
jgi:hypothetical protein